MAEEGAVLDVAEQSLRDAPAKSVPWVSLHDLASLLYYCCFRLLSTWVPASVLYRIADPLFQLRFRALRGKAVERLKACPGAGIVADQAPKIARRCISKLATSEIDNLLLSNSSFERRIRCDGIDGLHYLEQACAAGKGVMLLTVHLHASRLGKRHLATLGYPVMTVHKQQPVQETASRFHRRFLYPRRAELTRKVLHDEIYVQQPDCVLQVLKRLRSGGLVNIPLDGGYFRKAAPWPFLGVPWRFSAGYFDLVRLSRCAVIPMLCTGNGAGFRIRLGKPVDMIRANGPDEYLAANLPLLVGIVERQIQEHPADWSGWIAP